MKLHLLLLGLLMLSFSAAACSSGNIEISDPTISGALRSGESIDVDVTITNNRVDDDLELTTEVTFYDKDGDTSSDFDGDDTETKTVREEDSEVVSFDFDIDDDAKFSEYDIHIKTYVNGDEDNFCREVRKEIRVNAFGSCSNSNLTIDRVIDNDNGWNWKTGEKEDLIVKLIAPVSGSYELELIFVDNNYNEVDMTDDSLTDDITISNGTTSVDFSFEKNAIPTGTYGLYVIARDGDLCSELKEKDRTNEDNPNVIVWDYTFINIKEAPGIIVEEVTGPTEVGKGTTVMYKVKLKNTGENEELVLVQAYSSGLLGEFEMVDFKAGTTRDVTFPVKIPNKVGSAEIIFFAEYDYNDRNDNYYESTSNYEHDKTLKVIIKESVAVPIVTPPTPVVNVTPPKVVDTNVTIDVNTTEQVVEEEKGRSKLLMFFVILIVGIIAYLVLLNMGYLE